MKKRILDALETRWEDSLVELRPEERRRLITFRPQLGETIAELNQRKESENKIPEKMISSISLQFQHKPRLLRWGRGL